MHAPLIRFAQTFGFTLRGNFNMSIACSLFLTLPWQPQILCRSRRKLIFFDKILFFSSVLRQNSEVHHFLNAISVLAWFCIYLWIQDGGSNEVIWRHNQQKWCQSINQSNESRSLSSCCKSSSRLSTQCKLFPLCLYRTKTFKPPSPRSIVVRGMNLLLRPS